MKIFNTGTRNFQNITWKRQNVTVQFEAIRAPNHTVFGTNNIYGYARMRLLSAVRPGWPLKGPYEQNETQNVRIKK
jgi:hypothetical protein